MPIYKIQRQRRQKGDQWRNWSSRIEVQSSNGTQCALQDILEWQLQCSSPCRVFIEHSHSRLESCDNDLAPCEDVLASSSGVLVCWCVMWNSSRCQHSPCKFLSSHWPWQRSSTPYAGSVPLPTATCRLGFEPLGDLVPCRWSCLQDNAQASSVLKYARNGRSSLVAIGNAPM